MTDNTRAISQAFIDARRNMRPLASFPLQQPDTLAEAYAIQEIELAAYGEPVGWKVAAVKLELRDKLGSERLAGPILKLIDARMAAGAVEVPAIVGGFSAVEAEFAFVIGQDLPVSGAPYSATELLAAVEALHIASEIAGSPLPNLSELGPTAVISDHGNNLAVVIDREIEGWRERSIESMTTCTLVNGVVIGEGGASRPPTGGPIGSLAFLVTHLAQYGRHLKVGDWVATGATTGVHKVAPGDLAVVELDGIGELNLQITGLPQTC